MKYISVLFKAIRKGFKLSYSWIFTPFSKVIFYLNGIKYGKQLKVNGLLKVVVTRRGKVNLGNNLTINSGSNHNEIGRQQITTFWVEGNLTIGNNVGMSSTAIICNHDIEIGNFVIIGGNTVIYDTDFHSLDPNERSNKKQDRKNAKYGKVTIEDNVFIGAHTTILKGVTIGTNAVIGACSLISKDVPANEIWAGNPARFLKINKH